MSAKRISQGHQRLLTDHGCYDYVRNCKTEGTDDKENLAANFVKKEKGNDDGDKLCNIQGAGEVELKLIVEA